MAKSIQTPWSGIGALALALALMFPVGARSNGPCLARIAPLLFDRQKISDALHAVPGLQEQMTAVMNDPEIPRAIRLTVKRALENQDTEVVGLTEEIRKSWNLPESAGALSEYKSASYLLWPYSDRAATTDTLNEAASKVVRLQFKSGHGVLAQDWSPGSGQHHLSLLVHELAHIRFEAFLTKRFDQICASLPASFARRGPNGQWSMNSQFQDLLHERYANEMEREMSKAGAGKITDDWSPKWIQNKDARGSEVGKVVGDYLHRAYGYNDPQVVAVAGAPLSELLRGGPAVREVDQAVRLYGDPTTALPDAEEFPLALVYVRGVLREHGQKEFPGFVPSLIGSLLSAPRGTERMNSLFEQFILRAQDDPQKQKDLISNLVLYRTTLPALRDRGGWKFPKGDLRDVTWEQLVQAQPSRSGAPQN